MRIGKDCICNRCGSIVEEPHPDRISIYRHVERKYTDCFGKEHTAHEYKVKPGSNIHLCNHCRTMFDKFMRGEIVDDTHITSAL